MANLCCPSFIWIPFGQVLDDESDWIVRFLDEQALDDLDEKAGAESRQFYKKGMRSVLGTGGEDEALPSLLPGVYLLCRWCLSPTTLPYPTSLVRLVSPSPFSRTHLLMFFELRYSFSSACTSAVLGSAISCLCVVQATVHDWTQQKKKRRTV